MMKEEEINQDLHTQEAQASAPVQAPGTTAVDSPHNTTTTAATTTNDTTVTKDSTANKKTAEQIRKDQTKAAHNELVHPHRKLLHKIFIVISVLTATAALCLAIGEILAMVYESQGAIEYVLNAYLILACLGIILSELEWTKYTRESMILGHWPMRGLFYVFIGVVSVQLNDRTLEENSDPSQTSRYKNDRGYDIALNYTRAVSYIIMGFGILYFLMGLCCLHRVYNRLLKDYHERVETAGRVRKAGGGNMVHDPTDVETG
ncbi:hypothetical protein MPSEU_000364600 [Mayamaea pseudoterrestris]|nr:hypothetical protein MPSEU_000364600 [Mayamaea pseudoterrestris]